VPLSTSQPSQKNIMINLFLRRKIIETATAMNALDINVGKSGNVSARAPSTPHFYITPTGIPYAQTQPEHIVEMALDGSFEGTTLPSSEWRFHRDIYLARPEIQAIVHTHSSYATSLACLGRDIPAFHYMIAAAGGADIRCAPYATFGTQALSDFALEALNGRNACLLAQHGVIAVGASLEKALGLAVEVENLARMYWQALQIGTPAILSNAEMATVLEKFATYGQQSTRPS
jgi:L-fuculose-phosphate aldolase